MSRCVADTGVPLDPGFSRGLGETLRGPAVGRCHDGSVTQHLPRGVVPSLLLSGVVVLVVMGLARGVWLENLHNALLALAFAGVGTYVLFQRPRHREGVLFTATGVVEAVMFFGRQIGHTPSAGTSPWWAWLGVWPLAVALALTTVSVVLYPDGRFPATLWRWVAVVVVVVAVVCSSVSALWPVEYAAAGVSVAPPFHLSGFNAASAVWSHLAHPVYATFQMLWVVVAVQRWRAADGHVRQQLSVVLGAAAVSVIALLVGLAGWSTPRAGLLAAALVPVAAGWAIVQGQHMAAYSALSWLSRSAAGSEDLPTDLARAVSKALSAPAIVWMGGEERLLALGVWPETDQEIGATTAVELGASPGVYMHTIDRDGVALGAVSVRRLDPLSLAERKLFGDLAAQATLVIEHVTLADVVARESLDGHLDGLSPREHDVLQMMARGLSNVAICNELHLSIKTVEPVVSTIFIKLGLHADSASNRRVLAVLAYLRS
jgi:DNA-binding CsgD family transcriptional regulator